VGNAGRIAGDQPRGKVGISESRSEEDIRSRSSIQKVPGNVRGSSNTPLRRRGIVVFVPGVDGCSVIYQKSGCCNIAGEVQRRAAIAAFRMNRRRIGPQYFCQAIDKSKPGGRMNAQRSAAFH
jgi:hypothetical protein